MNPRIFSLLLVATVATGFAGPLIPVPDKIQLGVEDRQDFQIPDRVHQTGWVGLRSAASITNRLEKVDLDKLLEGFRHRPGRQDWIGEHAGKWLHAATLEWVNSGDPVLRTQLDYVAAELSKCQEPDGYLGTYEDKKHWTSWDVWVHAYNLIGLIAYVQYTGNTNLLPTCTRMADLLCDTFGDEPGKRDIIKSGTHVGMASTCVLKPMVLLHRMTGDPRYLRFCQYLVRAGEQPDGPHILSTLLTAKRVDKVGDAKAYEMLFCLNGILEYYRLTGDKKMLTACLNAWQDIVDHRIYLTGAMSYRELFHGDFDLPNVNNVGETCVTVTWLQFNAELLRLTGEARFADQLERVTLNQLLGAQLCDGSGWGYYVQMEGIKPYYKGTPAADGVEFTCCLSSGPRGLALIPTFAVTTDAAGAVVNLYESGRAKLTLRNGTPVEIDTDTLYPGEDQIRITVSPAAKKSFAVKLRIPSWCRTATIQVNGQKVETKPGSDGYVKIKRTWKPGDKIALNLKQEARLIVGNHRNQGKVAILYGPLVLAADEALLKADGQTLTSFAIAKPDAAALALTPETAPFGEQSRPGMQVFRIQAVSRKDGSPVTVHLISFADAGGTGYRYQVWLPLSANAPPVAPVAAPATAPAKPAKAAAARSAIRIDAGSKTNFTDAAGNVWLSDRGFDGGDVSVRADDMEIVNTTMPVLYRTEHWGMESFSQPLTNGKYVVKLHFAETYDDIKGPGRRVFFMNVGGQELKDFDVWVKAGGRQRAYVETVNVDITGGKLDITFESGVDNPEINGIEILPAP